MREIKFRAWLVKEKRMVAVSCIDWGNQIIQYDDDIDICSALLNDVILNQYVGLKDKNGKEIYEGDIVQWSDGEYKSPSNPRVAEVRFEPELSFFATNVCDGHKFGFSNFAYADEIDKVMEVIGNIYETPELLKKKIRDKG